MRKPPTTEDTRHSVSEHHEIGELLNDLAASDMASSGWLSRFRTLQERHTHHIDEEAVFERRTAAEKAAAEITPEKMEDAKD